MEDGWKREGRKAEEAVFFYIIVRAIHPQSGSQLRPSKHDTSLPLVIQVQAVCESPYNTFAFPFLRPNMYTNPP